MYHLQSNKTLNFEVNRQVVHSKIPEGRIRRLSVAVLVNYKFISADEVASANEENSEKEAVEKWVKLDQEELTHIEALARQAMGFSDLRGDSLTVANLKFTDQIEDENAAMVFLQKHEVFDMLKVAIKYLIYILIIWFAWRKVLRSIWIKIQRQYLNTDNRSSDGTMASEDKLDYKAHSKLQQKIFEDNMQQQQYIRKIVEKDPRVMALIIRGWMNKKDTE